MHRTMHMRPATELAGTTPLSNLYESLKVRLEIIGNLAYLAAYCTVDPHTARRYVRQVIDETRNAQKLVQAECKPEAKHHSKRHKPL